MAKAQASVNGNGFYDIKSLGDSLKCMSQETVELNHKFAQEVLDMPEFIGERTRRKPHVADLIHAMETGTFEWAFVNIVFCRCNEPHNGHSKGTVFRMNGQHTCKARLQVDAPLRAPVRLFRYTAATEADMRRLYATIDRNAPRTKGHQIGAYVNGTESYGHYKSHVRKLLPTGIAMWMWEQGADRARHGAEDVAYLMLKKEAPLCTKVAGFLDQFGKREYRHIMRGPVIAAMFETFRRSPNSAIEFWTAVATGVGFASEKDARRKLHKLILTTAVGSSGTTTARIGGDSLPGEAMYRLCIQAWNAWRKSEPVTAFRIPEKRPVAIA